jgi:hypothetical protein
MMLYEAGMSAPALGFCYHSSAESALSFLGDADPLAVVACLQLKNPADVFDHAARQRLLDILLISLGRDLTSPLTRCACAELKQP